ncbi:MAG: FAD-dependent oxidoreductase [Polyangiaceae bacterium]|nr:FAD-dependent oxidoreductase [Polyangiaceae bacterium]
MARVVVLGAGVAGHTAAMELRRRLGREHEVVVVTPNRLWNWIPSNIWVGVGLMTKNDVTFELGPVYAGLGIRYEQARAVELHADGKTDAPHPFVTIERTDAEHRGAREELEYDYLVNATGPKLNFGATPGLGPEGNTLSVCTFDHAVETAKKLEVAIERLKGGDRLTFVIGTGHGTCTCQGAAFEYAFNLEFELRKAGVREKARVVFLTNEAELGDFGVDGMQLRTSSMIIPGKLFAESLFAERGVEWVTGAHVQKVEPGVAHYETLDGELHTLDFDFAMLLPPFRGADLVALDRSGADITSEVFAPNGFMKVDADYAAKPYEEWRAEDWPRTYQSPKYPNIFAAGIAFAPPHAISRPRKTKNGTMIAPAPPRTGMPSGIIGRTVARSIVSMIEGATGAPTHTASMATMGAACVASAGASFWSGTAASMTMFPIVPDYQKYPIYGRDLFYTTAEIGSAGHRIKSILHTMFLYKAKAKPGWWLIPE